MTTHRLKPLHTIAALALLSVALPAAAAAPAPIEPRELIYCADRMTHEEREDYRAKMRAARSSAEKEALRAAHRADMQARAASRGQAGACESAGRQWHKERGGQGK